MSKENTRKARHALKQAQLAIRKGSKAQAHVWASRAAQLCPHIEEPWLILAAVGTPKASVYYLNHALHINPESSQAQAALWWALQRQAAAYPAAHLHESALPQENTCLTHINDTQRVSSRLHPSKRAVIPWMIALVACIMLAFTSLLTPRLEARANTVRTPYRIHIILKPINNSSASAHAPATLSEGVPHPQISLSPNPSTATSAFVQGKTATKTLQVTSTSLPTATSTLEPTSTPIPTATLPPPPVPILAPPPVSEQSNPVSNNAERWIDVDLSNQKVYAYEGEQIIREFLVSTGTYRHPTVTGQYRIYLKLIADDMSGPGYYLPDVPYTMYFYKGYSFHGTYWHDNFGTPMSHGCVNMRTSDAQWLFEWADTGTMVNIHY
ncbi:MAG: L,D-transpeptidase [Anaerolineae bacterium]|nr:L,D-transpeptidase [Anaerolineae bacterium]